MVSNQTEWTRVEQRSVLKFLMAEKSKPCESYRSMYDVYGGEFFSQKTVKELARHGFVTTRERKRQFIYSGT